MPGDWPARGSPANHDRPLKEAEDTAGCLQHSSHVADQVWREDEAREGRLEGRQQPGACGRQHQAPPSSLMCPLPSPTAWAQMGAVPTSSSSSPILMEKGSTAEKTWRMGKTARWGDPGRSPRGQVWTDVDAIWHPSVRHFILTGQREWWPVPSQSSGTTSAERRGLGPGPCPPPGGSAGSDWPRPRLLPPRAPQSWPGGQEAADGLRG